MNTKRVKNLLLISSLLMVIGCNDSGGNSQGNGNGQGQGNSQSQGNGNGQENNQSHGHGNGESNQSLPSTVISST